MIKKNSIIFSLIIASLFFDFFRDYLFQNINFQIHYLSHFTNGLASTLNMTDSRIEPMIDNLNLYHLNSIKWILSLFFIFVYQLITIFLAKIFFKKNGIKIFLPIVIILSLFSLLSHLFSNYSDSLIHSYSFYYISIEISHFLQSSLIVISLLMLFKVYLQLNTSSNK